jgi:hypothetical protein
LPQLVKESQAPIWWNRSGRRQCSRVKIQSAQCRMACQCSQRAVLVSTRIFSKKRGFSAPAPPVSPSICWCFRLHLRWKSLRRRLSVPSSGYSFRPFRCAFSVFVRGNDEQQAQRCADSVHFNHVPVRLRPAPGHGTLLRRRLPRRHRRPKWPIQARRSPQSPKRRRPSANEIRHRASSIRIGRSEARTSPIASAKRPFITVGAISRNAIFSNSVHNAAGYHRASNQRANCDCSTGTCTKRKCRSETLAVPCDRRILRAPDPAPQLRRKFRRG